MSYQFRFAIEDKDFDEIFNEKEILQRFEIVLEENEEMVTDKISSIKKFLIHSIEDQKQKLKLQELQEENVFLEFIECLKYRILWLATNELLHSRNSDVKQNILNLLNSKNKTEILVNGCIYNVFSVITRHQYDNKLTKFLELN